MRLGNGIKLLMRDVLNVPLKGIFASLKIDNPDEYYCGLNCFALGVGRMRLV